MKSILYRTALLLFASQTVIALDLHTDPACAQLKTAIEQAQPLEKIQDAWNTLLANGLTSKYETIELAMQVTAYAQEQKTMLEHRVTKLGTKTYDSSKLMWGSMKTGAGLWCAIGTVLYVLAAQSIYIIYNGAIQEILGWLLLPDMQLITSIPKSVKTLIPLLKKQSRNNYVFPALGLLRFAGTTWLLYSGISGIRQALTYRSTIEIKIKNLTAAIEFISPWTDPVLKNQFETRNWGNEHIPA